MNARAGLYIGLMSGSSLDGIDAALVHLDAARPELVAHHAHPLPAPLIAQIDALTRPGEDELARLAMADVQLGHCFAAAVQALLQQAGIPSHKVRAIGSHGQTLRHTPRPPHRHSLQIGDPNLIVEHTGITTVADFRRRDMAAGGQGAPLVPAFHRAVLQDAARDRIILNIGGTANLTLLPAASGMPVQGFDTGPGNALLDAWIQRHQGKPYDEGGAWAASGQVQADMLTRLLDEPYFHAAAPKSTGRDYFNLDWLERRWPEIPVWRPVDVQATLLELTAFTIAEAIRQLATADGEVLVCGGGVHNSLLMRRLQILLPEHNVASTARYGLDPDWVEAMAFAWLAQQTLLRQPGNVPAVTGAHHPVILGAIYPA